MPGGYFEVLLRLMKADQRQDVPGDLTGTVITVPPLLATTFVVRFAQGGDDDDRGPLIGRPRGRQDAA